MRDFSSATRHLQALRQKFEALLKAARARAGRLEPTRGRPSQLREVTSFGANPGNLRMWLHVPQRLPRMAPLVVALHGCGQDAGEYDLGTGWSELADRVGFAVLYPEQQVTNNPKSCFSWFLPDDIRRGHGEARSIAQMVAHAGATIGSDPRRVFVTGLSAGGAMAAVMLATYPDIFAGGAIIAGLPYGCARNAQQAFEAMFGEQTHPAEILGRRVRTASSHAGPWPKLSIWHGSNDPIVKPSNAEELIRQWSDVHALASAPSYEELIGPHRRRVWADVDGEALIEAFSIAGMGHGVPLATPGAECCGNAGAFFLEAGISSTHHTARFWGLTDALRGMPYAAAIASEPRPVTRNGGAPHFPLEAAHTRAEPGERPLALDPAAALDPDSIIAAAFRTAGLPAPNDPATLPGTTRAPAPGPIIAAALKAAGLIRRHQ